MGLNKSLQYLIWAGIFILPITPLIVSGSLLFPFITGKAFFFRLVVEVIFAAWILLLLRDPEFRPRRSAALWAAVMFTLVLILATVFSLSPARSFWSNFERMEGLLSYLHLLAYFVVLLVMLQSEQIWRRLFKVSLGVSVVVAIYGLFQLLGWAAIHQGGTRVDASLGNATYLAVYLLFHIFLAAWLYFTQAKKTILSAGCYGGIILLELVILYYTATRGALLGLLAGLSVLGVTLTFFGRGKVRRAALGVVGVVVVLVLGFWLIKDSAFVQNSPVLSRFASISPSEATTESRLLIWRMSLQGVKERPLLGWGPENYYFVFNKYYDPALWRQEPWFDRSHNVFFDWLISAGLLGMLGYLSLFAVAVWAAWRLVRDPARQVEGGLFLGLLAAYFVHNFFVFDHLVSYLLFFAVVAYLTFTAKLAGAPWGGNFSLKTNTASLVAAILIIGMLGAGIYFFNWRPIMTSRSIIKGISFDSRVPLPTSIERQLGFLTTAVSGGYLGRSEAREQLLSFADQLASIETVPTPLREQALQLAFQEMEQEVKSQPRDPRPAFLLGNFLLSFNQSAAARPFLEQAVALSPRKQIFLFSLGWAELNSGAVDAGLKRLAGALALAPDYLGAVKAYALALDNVGRTGEALAVVRDFIETYPEQAAEGEKLIADLSR